MNILDRQFQVSMALYAIVGFWTMFYLMSVIDKFLMHADVLWVGKNRLAQFSKLFGSIGIESLWVSLVFLIIVAAIETIGLVFFSGALYKLWCGCRQQARVLFLYGTMTGLGLFTFFSIGDQIFGERFELLEHTIYWVIILVSWLVYRYFDEQYSQKLTENGTCTPQWQWRYMIATVVLSVGFVVAFMTPVVMYYQSHFNRVVIAQPMGGGVYKFDLPFFANRGVWEDSLTHFIRTNPQLEIVDITTAPDELQTKADNTIMYVVTR